MSDSDQVRITVTVDVATAAKIGELAERMNASQSKMASWLLEAGLADNEFIIRVVTARVTRGLREALQQVTGGRKKKKTTAGGTA